MRSKHAWLYLLVVTLSLLVSVIVFAPAVWLGQILEKQTQGRVTLIDPHGTLWRGEASIGVSANPQESVKPFVKGRFRWKLSPLLVIGHVNLWIDNQESLSHPVRLTGGWQQWQLGAASLLLPADALTALGAPWNTLALSGGLKLTWNDMHAKVENGGVQLKGAVNVAMDDIGSRLSPINPLGSYRMDMTWQGQQAPLRLSTIRGPLLLQGEGMIQNGRIQFSGTADAAAGQEEKLANLLNLLGQRRQQGGKNVIAFEFK